ncbi:MAG: FkbM family methyltransferase [Bacteroidia bacterium]
MIKKLLKIIRGYSVINIPVRTVIKWRYWFSKKTFVFFSIHWPVYGIIRFGLPNGKKVKIYSRGDDFVSTQAFWKGYDGYEGPSVRLYYHLAAKSSVIIDIGANVGYYTLIGAGANNNASVYAFEPVPAIYERLEKNIGLNNYKNAVPINSAIGNSEIPLKFYLPNTKGMAHAGSTKKGWASDTIEIEVKSYSLDNFKSTQGIKRIDLVKMDCEFHEVEALNGMQSILKTDKPLIIMEVLFPEGKESKGHFENNYYLEIERIMKENGYYFYLISETALIRLDSLEYNPDERNYLFSAKKSPHIYLSFSDMDTLSGSIL